MYRFADKKLVGWKDQKKRKPLIVRGMRQVGKTYSVTHFAEQYFPGRIHKIDFEMRADLCAPFETNLDVKRILAELELLLGIKITPGKDLLFFDEIQNCPNALRSLRYFYEEMPALHVIAAGSLLDFALGEISFPVGRVQFLDVYPMSFHEFLRACGKDAAAKLITACNPQKPAPAVHKMLLEEVRKYFFVGGMPECVKIFSENGKFQEVFEIQAELITAFRQDFSHYKPFVDKHCLDSVLVNSARSVGRQTVYAQLTDTFSGPTIKKAYTLLEHAHLVRRVPAVAGASIPLGASASPRKFKTLFADIGLMKHLCGVRQGEEYFRKDLLAIHNGALAEQFIGQEILAAGNSQIFYWSRNAKSSTAEVDYMIEKKGTVCPIEVKSGPAGKLRSMHLLLNSRPKIPIGYVLSTAEAGELPAQRLRFVPLYFSHSLFAPSAPEV